MEYKSVLISVKNIEKSKEWYTKVLGLEITDDFGENVTLGGCISLQSESSWKDFILQKSIAYGNSGELYFETDNIEKFAQKLENNNISLVHPIFEHRWGQKVIRFYDPDNHIIEVGENLKTVIERFIESGMNEEETAKRMDIPLESLKRIRQSE